MFVPSPNIPASPLLLFVYCIIIIAVYLASSPGTDPSAHEVLPLQQSQPHPSAPISRDFLSDLWCAITRPGAPLWLLEALSRLGAPLPPAPGAAHGPSAREVDDARRFVRRQWLRAVRHADYMRLETLHFLRLMTTTIPRLRLVWRGDDFCRWDGVTCRVWRVPLEDLVDVPKAAHRLRLTSPSDDPAPDWAVGVTLVELRLRGMGLHGYVPSIRPIGAAAYAEVTAHSAHVARRHAQRFPRAWRAEARRDRPIRSPREGHYWPWDPPDMRLHARHRNSTYEMVRYTLRRVLRRLELRGAQHNHSDLQSPPPEESAPSHVGNTWGTEATQTESHAQGGTDPMDGVVAMLTKHDMARVVFGEVEPRLVGIHVMDVAMNPSLLTLRPTDMPFPYLRSFYPVGTMVRQVVAKELGLP